MIDCYSHHLFPMLLKQLFCSRLVVLGILVLHHKSCYAETNRDCAASSCGHIHNISYPFRLKQDPKHCGDLRYELSCENNNTFLYLYFGKYYVQALNYKNYTIRVVDVALQQEKYSSIPHNSLARFNFSEGDPYTWFKHKWEKSESYPYLSNVNTYLNCAKPVHSPLYVDNTACFNKSKHFSNKPLLFRPKRYMYIKVGQTTAFNLEKWCQINVMAMKSWPGEDENISCADMHNELLYGFELSWFQVNCGNCPRNSDCYLDNMDHIRCLHHGHGTNTIKLLIDIGKGILYTGIYYTAAKTFYGTPVVFLILIMKWKRRHQSAYVNIEEYLRNDNSLMPVRYSYFEIKEMSRNFKDKLGEGGYGSVYKGKLKSGRLVAIKLLGKAEANGQDFINEISTIGRIYHVNLAQLIGFCVDGSKCALVYEFMANGSLDKLIFSTEANISFSWKKMYDISLGTARGIEYLHRGCNMKILHFDIKPHNILLGENFTPKVSDFGLAKICPAEMSIVSLTAARGTMGYMAPELFYRNIGTISYKADVYSFGMLLMEMASRRRNLNAFADNSSQIYYPSWVYDKLNEGKEIEIENATEEEKKIVLKMIIVALWCIQMNPANRPAMNTVLEMLEGEVDILTMPPKPSLSLPRMEVQDQGVNTDSEGLPLSEPSA